MNKIRTTLAATLAALLLSCPAAAAASGATLTACVGTAEAGVGPLQIRAGALQAGTGAAGASTQSPACAEAAFSPDGVGLPGGPRGTVVVPVPGPRASVPRTVLLESPTCSVEAGPVEAGAGGPEVRFASGAQPEDDGDETGGRPGNGHGQGDGNGHGQGNGNGHGQGDGNGHGQENGNGHGQENGNGHGQGQGNGNGGGSGQGARD